MRPRCEFSRVCPLRFQRVSVGDDDWSHRITSPDVEDHWVQLPEEPWERERILRHFEENRPGDHVIRFQKAADESIGGATYTVWRFLAATGEWWLVAGKYDVIRAVVRQPGETPHRILREFVAMESGARRYGVWMFTAAGRILLSMIAGLGLGVFDLPKARGDTAWPGTGAQILVTLLVALALERQVLRPGSRPHTNRGRLMSFVFAVVLALWTLWAFWVCIKAATRGIALTRGESRVVAGDLAALAALVLMSIRAPL